MREVHEVLPQVHELPKEHLRQLKESNQLEAEISQEQLERYKRVYVEQPIRSVLDIINDAQTYKYVVILGDPGSGKSTLLQFLALNWAKSPLDNVISQPIPLLVELRTYMRNFDSGHCTNFLEFFHKSPGSICHLNQHQLDEQLKAGKAFVMFDGLDEVFDPGKREDVITCIHRFTNDYPNVRVIVTSRVIGYKPQRLRDAQFRHFMLQDLDENQIKDFINRWHELTFNDEADKVRKRERLQRAIETSKAIAELAENPLLLTMMAILNRNQELPRDRPELYNQASRVLLHQWDVERALVEDSRLDPKTLDYKDKQAMLRHVAYHMQGAEKGLAGNLISGNNLEKILTSYLKSIEVDKARDVAKLMIHQLRTRNFILCHLGADYYAFVHRTFLEYFCAWEFVWQFKETQTLTIEQLKTDVFDKHWQDESWHEVLRLIAGMIEAKFTGGIIEYLIAQKGESENFTNLFLAAQCLSEVRNHAAIISTDAKLFAHLRRLLKYGSGGEYPTQEESKISGLAVSAITTTWKDNPKTLAILKACLQPDNYWTVREAAVRNLAKDWKDNPDTLPTLKTCAQVDTHTNVLETAVRELVIGWKDDSDILPMLKTYAQLHKISGARSAAVQELARGWKDDPDTLPLLKQRATADDHWDVRSTAVQELARGWKDDPDTLPLLKQRATADDDEYVRSAAAEALARGWKDELGMFELLHDIALHDPFKRKYDLQDNPRQTALEAITKLYRDQPQTLSLLRDRAENDPDEKVREFAKNKLENWS